MEIETGTLQAAGVRGKTAKAARGKGLATAKAARGKGLAQSKPKPSQEEEKEIDYNAVRDETAAERMARLVAEMKASWAKRVAEAKAAREALDKQGVPEKPLFYEDKEHKYLADQASEFRDTWNSLYSLYDGHFEETTKIRNKRFTHKKPAPSDRAGMHTTLQIFSVKVSRIRGGLKWPLQVFGMVAIRDCVDHTRNIIFNRPRDNCQVITQEVPYLKLIGPSRAVLLLDPATFEIDLKVKGTTEAEDACLSFLAVTFINFSSQLKPEHFTRDYPCRLSTLEFELGSIMYSVEATIDVRIISGSWPERFRAQFAASTGSIRGAQVILLDSGDDRVQVNGYGKKITLSRCVVSAETGEDLWISVKALQGDKVVANRNMPFKPRKASTSDGVLRLGFCILGFTISWSLVSSVP